MGFQISKPPAIKAVIREATIHEVVGGISTVLRHLMRTMIPPISSLMSTGIVIQMQERTLLVKVKPGVLLGDELALKDSVDSKGASGLRACLQCKNVIRTQSSRRLLRSIVGVQPYTL